MEAYLKYMKEIPDKLASIGSPVAEENQVVTLLGSLPHSYLTLVNAIEVCADNDLSCHKFNTHLSRGNCQ